MHQFHPKSKPSTTMFIAIAFYVFIACFVSDKSMASGKAYAKHKIAGSVPSITALLRTKTGDSNQYSESWVSMSPMGMFITNAELEIVKNFNKKSVWLIDRTRNMKHHIDLVKHHVNYPSDIHYSNGPEARNNIMGLVPCANWYPKYIGERVWRGQIIEEWLCSEESGVIVNTQYYEREIGLVVRVEMNSDRVDELVNIAPQERDDRIYEPNSSLNEVSLKEFIVGKSNLRIYEAKTE